MKIDAYSIKARLMPSFLVLLPFGLALAAWFPTQISGWKSAVAAAAYCGALVWLAELGRDQGKKKEPALFKMWGGKPTTRLLRHRHSALDSVTLARYHSVISKFIGKPLPNRDDEEFGEKAADELYESGVKMLLEKTRDQEKFALLFKENVSYGFRRNLWGMKPAAILICSIGLMASLVPVYLAIERHEPAPPMAFCMAPIIIVLLVWWLLRVTPQWVRLPADAYAQRLLAACDTLETASHQPIKPA
jgi:hypothetical protein